MSDSVSLPTSDPPMYEQYYGLAQSPFTLSPDPRFLYLSESHDDALRALLQALRRKEGFIVLAGDIGTGKTTLCRALVERLDRTTFTSLVLDPFLSVEELLRDMLLDFGIASRDAARNGRLAAASRHELIATLREFLLSLVPLQGSGVLIIDEAQHLSSEVLEQIRIVANLETNQSKLLQIVLVGQLNLLDTLAAAEMRQLAQRVSVRARLKPLTRADVAGYVAHRLSVASTGASVTFEPAAVDAIHHLSGGVPRVINLLCDRALALGAGRAATSIDAAAVSDAAAALALTSVAPVARATSVDGRRGLPTAAAAPTPVETSAIEDFATAGSVAVNAATSAPPPRRGRLIAAGIISAVVAFAAGAAGARMIDVDVTPPFVAPPTTVAIEQAPAIAPLPIPDPPPVPRRRPVPPPEPTPEPPPLPAPILELPAL